MAIVIGGPNNNVRSGPAIDGSSFPAPVVGQSAFLVKPAPIRWNDDLRGGFRTFCKTSHINFDDAVVSPGRPGVSHAHIYAGNTAADAHLDLDRIREFGTSTCPGGSANKSAYWSPVVIDTRTGRAVPSTGNEVYYKLGYNLPPGTKVHAPALGMRMLAGSAMNDKPSGPFKFTCIGNDATTGASINISDKHIPNCPAGTTLWASIMFPQCWNGELDAPDHKSHVSYPVANPLGGRMCPVTHPMAIPEITFNWQYRVTEANETTHWRLSSQMYGNELPAGYDMHGDWVNGWDPEVMQRFVTHCLNTPAKNCHNDLLGDGGTLYWVTPSPTTATTASAGTTAGSRSRPPQR